MAAASGDATDKPDSEYLKYVSDANAPKMSGGGGSGGASNSLQSQIKSKQEDETYRRYHAGAYDYEGTAAPQAAQTAAKAASKSDQVSSKDTSGKQGVLKAIEGMF